MAITFRGKATSLNNIVGTQNSQAHNMQSAAGHRDDVGGEDTSLRQAKSAFASRNSSPVTLKAKSSPLQMNEALVAGAASTGKKFVNVGAEVGKAFEQYKKKPIAADLTGKKESKEESKEEGTKERKAVEIIPASAPGVNI